MGTEKFSLEKFTLWNSDLKHTINTTSRDDFQVEIHKKTQMHDAWRGGDNNFMDSDEKLLQKMWISFQWNEAKDIRSNDFRLPIWISNVCFRWALRSKHWFLLCKAVLLNRIDTSVPIILKSIFWSEAVRLTAVVIKFRSRSGCIELIKTRSRAVCVYQEIYSWRREEETSQVFWHEKRCKSFHKNLNCSVPLFLRCQRRPCQALLPPS